MDKLTFVHLGVFIAQIPVFVSYVFLASRWTQTMIVSIAALYARLATFRIPPFVFHVSVVTTIIMVFAPNATTTVSLARISLNAPAVQLDLLWQVLFVFHALIIVLTAVN